MNFQKLQSKYLTNYSKNGQHQNGNNSLSKFNTLPNNLNHNDVEDDLEQLSKVFFFFFMKINFRIWILSKVKNVFVVRC